VSDFVLVHGGGDSGWAWHLVEAELRARGLRTAAPDLPLGPDVTLAVQADAVIAAADGFERPVVVGHSFGGFVASLVADPLAAQTLVFVTGMVPLPGEAPGEWWERTGYADSGAASGDDDGSVFFHDVPPPLAEEARRRARNGDLMGLDEPWPMARPPAAPARFVLCTEDRFFPPAFMRRVVGERLGVEPDEIAAGHCAPLSRPREVAGLLERYATAD
jgi:pimeloyl-ACP methyl ester carboxylesterase